LSYIVKYEDIGFKDYKETWDYQEIIFQTLIAKKLNKTKNQSGINDFVPGTLIFVEHPHVYTLGKNGSQNNLLLNFLQLHAKGASFYRIDRGGDITYHGPGQLVGYPIFDLETLGVKLKDYINLLEESVIRSLEDFNIKAGRLSGATGVWIEPETDGRARKICAIGVRASRYVTMHGFAFNVNTDLRYFSHINPCGFTDKGVTSLEKEIGSRQNFDEVKTIVRGRLKEVFGLEWVNKN
jgi:lipoyl(octanoyl) transferase